MKSKKEILYLGTAGYVIKLVFEPSEQLIFAKQLISSAKDIWKNFIVKKPKTTNFEITIAPNINYIPVLAKPAEKQYFFLTYKKNFKNNKITTFYSASIYNLDYLLKEVLAFLLLKNGFLFHCSSVLNKNAKLNIFAATSKGGKSTTARLFQEVGMKKFNDDILIVKRVQRKWNFFSPSFVEKDALPFPGKCTKATFFFISKPKVAKVRQIVDKTRALRLFLKQIWLRGEVMPKEVLKIAMEFVSQNDFYELFVNLKPKELEKVINEI